MDVATSFFLTTLGLNAPDPDGSVDVGAADPVGVVFARASVSSLDKSDWDWESPVGIVGAGLEKRVSGVDDTDDHRERHRRRMANRREWAEAAANNS